MRRASFFVVPALLSCVTAIGCTDSPSMPVNVNDASGDADVVLDVPLDRPDSSTDAGDGAVPTDADAAITDVRDVTPIDVPPGTTWCDLPQTADSMVRGVTLPEGFCIRRYGRLAHPRVMQFAPNGDLFIASWLSPGPGGTGPGIGAIVVAPDDNRDGVADNLGANALPDANRDQVADDLGIYANAAALPLPGSDAPDGWSNVHGILFANGYLYFTSRGHVYRIPHTPGMRRVAPGTTPELLADISDSVRPTHTLAMGPDGALYVTLGNYGLFACPNTNPRQGAVLRIRSSPTDTSIPLMGTIVAQGFRNPMYMRCHAWGCYAAELTDDGWTAPGREKIMKIESGQNYGYPCCYDRNLPSPANGGRQSCAEVTPSLVGFPVGYTPFGHDFAPSTWPAPYANALFIGLHGQVGSWNDTGINWAPADPTTHAFMSENATRFISGWGRGTANEGRVAELLFAPDGRLFFTDDQQGHIYWIAPTSLRIPSR